MKSVIEYLRENKVLTENQTKSWCVFEDGSKLDLVDLIRKYAEQIIDEVAFRAELRDVSYYNGDEYSMFEIDKDSIEIIKKEL